jgi:hypothetical protein
MVGSGEIRDPGVIIIGAGVGGFSAAKSLAFDITLIDRYNVTGSSRCCTNSQRLRCRRPVSHRRSEPSLTQSKCNAQ